MQVETTIDPTTNAPVFSTCMPHGGGGTLNQGTNTKFEGPSFFWFPWAEGFLSIPPPVTRPFSCSGFCWGYIPSSQMGARGPTPVKRNLVGLPLAHLLKVIGNFVSRVVFEALSFPPLVPGEVIA